MTPSVVKVECISGGITAPLASGADVKVDLWRGKGRQLSFCVARRGSVQISVFVD